MKTIFMQQIKIKQNTSDIFDIKYIMTNMIIAYEQTLKNVFFLCHLQH